VNRALETKVRAMAGWKAYITNTPHPSSCTIDPENELPRPCPSATLDINHPVRLRWAEGRSATDNPGRTHRGYRPEDSSTNISSRRRRSSHVARLNIVTPPDIAHHAPLTAVFARGIGLSPSLYRPHAVSTATSTTTPGSSLLCAIEPLPEDRSRDRRTPDPANVLGLRLTRG
jgi:hypothetical protein